MAKSRTASLLDADWARLQAEMGRPAGARRCRDCLSPRFAHIAILRYSGGLEARGWHRLAKLLSLANVLLFGLEVPASVPIGPGLIMPHPQGIILGASRIGANVTIYQQVTLGAKIADWSFDPTARPVVEDGVVITAGAKVIGPIRLGASSVVGANAAVLEDVAPGTTVGGVPARVIGTRTPD